MAAAQLLYLTSTASTVVSANASVAQMSLTPGAAATTGTSIANGTVAGTWQYIPGTASQATLGGGVVTPTSKGWIFDGIAPGSYATGIWALACADSNTSNTGVAVEQFQLFLVTATTTTVTKVSQIFSSKTSSAYTPTLTATAHNIGSGSIAGFSVAAGQYLYVEAFFKTNTAGTSASAVNSLVLDAPSGAVSQLTTPVFTAAGGTLFSQSLTAGLSFVGAVSNSTSRAFTAALSFVGAQRKVVARALSAALSFVGAIAKSLIPAATGTLTTTTLGLNPAAYYRMNEAAGVALTDSSTAAINGTYQAAGVTYATTPPLTSNDAGSPLFDGSTGYATTGVPVASALVTGSAFSVSVWILTGATIANEPIVGNAFPPTDVVGFVLRTDGSGTATAYIATTGGNNSLNGVTALLANTKYFLVLTYDGATMRLYRNGAQTTTTALTGAIKASTHAAAIGFLPGYTDHFSGKISEVSLYPTALTAANVSALYSAGNSTGATIYTNLLTASVGFAGAQTRSTLRSFFASVATIGTQTKALSRSMAASVTFAGVQGRIIPTALAAVLSFAGDLATFFAKGGLTAIGNREYTAGATGTGKNAPGATGTGDNPGGSVGNEQ